MPSAGRGEGSRSPLVSMKAKAVWALKINWHFIIK